MEIVTWYALCRVKDCPWILIALERNWALSLQMPYLVRKEPSAARLCDARLRKRPRQSAVDDEDAVALITQGSQECSQVQRRQGLRRREERVEIPPFAVPLPDRKPVLLYKGTQPHVSA